MSGSTGERGTGRATPLGFDNARATLAKQQQRGANPLTTLEQAARANGGARSWEAAMTVRLRLSLVVLGLLVADEPALARTPGRILKAYPLDSPASMPIHAEVA